MAVLALAVLAVAAACVSVEGVLFHHNAAKKHFDPIPAHVATRLENAASAMDGFNAPISLEQALAATPAQRMAWQEAAKVKLPEMVHHNGADERDIFAYSGYVQVDAVNNGALFYWFFEAMNGDKNAPVLLWLQGGPGGSSMFGLLAENGPYYLTDDLQLTPRNVTWNENYAMLYIDNPLGVGFSYVENDAGYSRDEQSVANNLFTGLSAFFAIYSQYQANDFYVTGESYAGKYIPATAYRIHQANHADEYDGVAPAAVPINLVGISVGDGWTDPRIQVQGYAALSFNFGLASNEEYLVMKRMQDEAVRYIDREDWANAARMFETLIDGPLPNGQNDYWTNITGCTNYYDVRKTNEPSYGGNEDAYLNQTSIRQALHVGDHYYDMTSGYAGLLLTNDLAKSMAPLLPTVFDNYKCLFYNGQFDVIVGAALTEAYLPTIRWSGAEGLRRATKTIWKVNADDADVAGYVRQYANFTQAVVRDAGHILPFDQPERAFDMITRFVDNIPFTV